MRSLNHSMWSRLRSVAVPFFKSDVRAQALGGATLLIVILLAINGMNVVNSYVGRDFMTALAERQLRQFYVLAAALAGVFAISTTMEVLARYAEQWLGLFWRNWLTRHFLDRYLAGRTYLQLTARPDIDNPDERISEDVKTFTTTTLSIAVLMINGVLIMVAFSGVLWSITPWLFLAAVGYAAAGSFGTILLGRRLVDLNQQQLRKEGDLRFALGRTREHAEEIAQVGGEQGQKTRLGRRLASVVDNFRSVIRVNRNLGFFTTGYKYLPQIIPALIVGHLYVEGAVEFGVVTQGAMAFSQVQGAFALIVLQFQELTTYAAVIGRLGALWEATQPGALGPTRIGPLPRAPACPSPQRPSAPHATVSSRPVVETSPDAGSIAYEQLTLWTPDEERPVVRDLSIEVAEGQRWAIRGSRGPSALLLATAGLWQEGEGRIHRPGPGDVMFVPQRVYSASGRLRDILMDGIGREIPDDRLRDVLEGVGLKPILEHSDGLNAECDWATILSAGDLQALTIARLLLVNPRFAFLDNPAGDLGTDFGERLYRALADSPITYVSAGCPDALLSFHARRLEIQDDGSWRSEST